MELSFEPREGTFVTKLCFVDLETLVASAKLQTDLAGFALVQGEDRYLITRYYGTCLSRTRCDT